MQLVLLPVCAALLLGYLAKIVCLYIIKQRNKDLDSQGGIASVAAGAMCLMSIGAKLHDNSPVAGVALWGMGVVLHLCVCIRFIQFTAGRGIRTIWEHIDAYVVVPMVGIAAAGATGASLPDEVRPVAWAALLLGLFFTVLLVPLLLAEMLHPRSTRWSAPCAAILAAPVSLCSVGWLQMRGQTEGDWSVVTQFLAYASVCIAAPVIFMLPRLLMLPFGFNWAAYTFPLAITAINALSMHELTKPGHGWDYIGECSN
jgi:tellurite resistance protein TehA-like permease